MSEDDYIEVELSEDVLNKLINKRKELKAEGAKLKDGKSVETNNDVITYLLDHYEAKHGKLL